MDNRRKFALGIGLVLFGLVIFFVFTIWQAGEIQFLEPHRPDKCVEIKGLLGSEDITVDQETGLAFISSADLMADQESSGPNQGAIFGLDLKSENPDLVKLTDKLSFVFRPVGLSLFKGADGKIQIVAVNRRPEGNFLEIFDFDGTRLIHRRSIGSPLLINPNDVLAVAPDRYYVTNAHGSENNLIQSLETFFRIGRANVVFFDGTEFKVVADGLKFANGINWSPDGKMVYVAETLGKRIQIYNRNPKTGDLDPVREVDVDTGVDNIEVDTDGSLYVAGHPKLLSLLRFIKNARPNAPSQILKVTFGPDLQPTVFEVYLSEGEDLSAASVGAPFQKQLVLGSMLDDKVLVCTMNN